MRRRGHTTIPNRVGVNINGVGSNYAVGEFIKLGVGSGLTFNRRCSVRVRGKGAAGFGGHHTFASDANGGGGADGAVDDTGVVVTIEPIVGYTATIGAAGASAFGNAGVNNATKFTCPSTATTYLDLRGGENGEVDGVGAAGLPGAGGAVIVGSGGALAGETGATGYAGVSSPDEGVNGSRAGASGGAGDNAGGGGKGGDAAGAGEPGGPLSAPHGGGCGRNGVPFLLTGDDTNGGGAGGGAGAGNVANAEVGSTLYTFIAGSGRMTIEVLSIG